MDAFWEEEVYFSPSRSHTCILLTGHYKIERASQRERVGMLLPSPPPLFTEILLFENFNTDEE